MSTPLMTSTYSMWSLFRNCRKACEYRYVTGLVSLQKDPNLSFGSLIHECLLIWHGTRDLAQVLDHLERSCAARVSDDGVRRDWHLARAMMTAYATRYSREDFYIIALEKTFEGPIVNPKTGAASRSFLLAGKVDGIVRIGDSNYILEHKTAAQIDADYLERLWTDFQITIYAYYVEQTLGIPITGVIYNVLAKARLQQSRGETEDEYQTRRSELIAKSKSGTSTAKRKMPESDEEFQARLAEKYADPEMFHRETLYLSRERFDILREELWQLTQEFLRARNHKVFYQNTSFCFHHNRPCAYFAICRSNGNPNVIDNFFEIAAPHEELREAEPAF
ncbi:PD-(D/E)XK nuclease family protein [Paludibaculum fermentans]|uniref:PD-(D/E)XK nuclease family protein n=1 Tax=Paludibaculum fermentans TaxID=1473598 RepID=A0A7S7NR67_PALFE|nr:PD-(D/E)XK nuclease family protein [Paludibaculum fermentans]QOY88219.1 PD-(D/E)XK nuclease family protein [Paludibaculum fermentans]